ncbi:MAG: TRL domain-containing protein [Leptospiraceae bacterium]|nr:TRL domain-containing protein [Leptospiraceae bacterium]
MNKIIFILITLSVIVMNCVTSQVGNPSNTLFLNKGTNGFSGVKYDPTDKTGEACVTSIFLAFIAYGDASIQEAAASGGITKINSVSHQTYMGNFFQETCTVVRGK